MDPNNTQQLIRVFSGSDITVNLVAAELEKEGIASHIINEYEQSNFRGFSTGTPYSVDLYVLDADLGRAEEVVKGFQENID